MIKRPWDDNSGEEVTLGSGEGEGVEGSNDGSDKVDNRPFFGGKPLLSPKASSTAWNTRKDVQSWSIEVGMWTTSTAQRVPASAPHNQDAAVRLTFLPGILSGVPSLDDIVRVRDRRVQGTAKKKAASHSR